MRGLLRRNRHEPFVSSKLRGREDFKAPAHGIAVGEGAAVELEGSGPSAAGAMALRVRGGTANHGYWSFPARPSTPYELSLWVKADAGGPIAASLRSPWCLNLIGYDALSVYGSPSYYAQRMFPENLGDRTVPLILSDVGTQRRGAQTLPWLFASCTRDTRRDTVLVKLVNAMPSAQEVTFDIQGGVVRSDDDGPERRPQGDELDHRTHEVARRRLRWRVSADPSGRPWLLSRSRC